MTPEPLTKTKNEWGVLRNVPLDDIFVTTFDDVQIPIKDFIKEYNKHIEEWLLKEIEKEKKELGEDEAVCGLEIAEDIIKKAFEGVIEE